MIKSVNKYIQTFLFMMLFSTVLLHAEYGLGSTQDEVITKRNLSTLKYKIEQQDERIDGLTTIIEGLSASMNELRYAQQKKPAQNESQNKYDALLQKLAGMIDDINANYVSKKELQTLLAQHTPKTKQTPKKEKVLNTKAKENTTLYSEGVRHFGKKRYDEAKKRFRVTDKKGYKPAASNYYLGEIAYYTKQYEDAIFHFKKSAGLYDQASYIDTLLFHTAVSLEETGDKEQARAFYENIIENYPRKKTAKIAQKRLKKL
jgi:TolA-binding protein